MNANASRVLPKLSGRIVTIAFAVLAVVLGWTAFDWSINRIYVEPGQSLLLEYRGLPIPGFAAPPAEAGRYAEVDESGQPRQVGVLADMRGPGRHFYNPLWWRRTIVPDVKVRPGQVAVVTCKLGEVLPGKQFLVDGDVGHTEHKGILRKVLGPGTYRINPYGYQHEIVETTARNASGQIKQSGWVNIPTGHVGVVTNLADNPITGAQVGMQEKVLQPGIYPMNPAEQEVDVVEIGFREKSITVSGDDDSHVEVDEHGEPRIPKDPGGIAFPSADGFTIHMDFTAIWGVMPHQAADAVSRFGNIAAIEDKVVVPEIESVCRTSGSQLGAVELLVGESRQKFQLDVSKLFQEALRDKDVTLLYGLVRYIYIPQEVRQPIQAAFLADELKLTRDQEQVTARMEAKLREAERRVLLETERIKVETDKKVAAALATGRKQAEQTRAETLQMVASIDRQTAELDAQAKLVLGKAEADARRKLAEAEAQKFDLAVRAFGTGQAYNQWVFAKGLPDDLKLHMLYAGDGTFWTDLKGFSDIMLGRQAQQQQAAEKSAAPATPAVAPAKRQATQ